LPFQGNFIVNGQVSAKSISLPLMFLPLTGGTMAGDIDMGNNNITNTNILCATRFYATSAYIQHQDIMVSELSGFVILGTDFNTAVPPSIEAGANNVTLNGVGLSSTSWMRFEGDIETGTSVAAGGGLSAQQTSQAPVNLAYNGVTQGDSTFTEGYQTSALADYAHAEGDTTLASGANSHAEGDTTKATGVASHAEGGFTTASDNYAHAEGVSTQATAWYTHAEGDSTQATAIAAHSEGTATRATAQASHAEGNTTLASGNNSHSEGLQTTSQGANSHAEGDGTKANGSGSHAEGEDTVAQGTHSHAAGRKAHASYSRTYVWSSLNTVLSATTSDQYMVSASNGVILGQNVTVVGNVSAAGGNSVQWNTAYGTVSAGTYGAADGVDINYNPTNYSTVSANISGNFNGIDTQLGLINDDITNIAAASATWGTQINVTVGPGLSTISSTATGTNEGVFYDLTIKNGVSARASNVMMIWTESGIQHVETSTADVGSTLACLLTANLVAGNAILQSNATIGTWTIKGNKRVII